MGGVRNCCRLSWPTTRPLRWAQGVDVAVTVGVGVAVAEADPVGDGASPVDWVGAGLVPVVPPVSVAPDVGVPDGVGAGATDRTGLPWAGPISRGGWTGFELGARSSATTAMPAPARLPALIPAA